MCPQPARLIIVVTVLVVAMFFRQHCQSAALKQSDADDNYADDPDSYGDDGGHDGYEYRLRRSSEKNLTHVRRRNGGVTQDSMSDFELEWDRLQSRVSDLERLVSTMGSDPCKGGQCVTGAMKYGCDCLLYVHTKMSWKNASNYCQGMTGRLVAIRSDRMQRNIKRFLKAQLGSRGLAKSRVYTGLIYTNADTREPHFLGFPGSSEANDWYWHSLEGVTPVMLHKEDFKFWAKGHPHPEAKVFKESCMHLNGTDKLRWVSSYCTVSMNFICHFASVPRDHCHRSSKGGKCRHSGSRKRKKKAGHGRRRQGKKGRRDGRGRNHRQAKQSDGETETPRDNDRHGGEARRDRDNDNSGEG